MLPLRTDTRVFIHRRWCGAAATPKAKVVTPQKPAFLVRGTGVVINISTILFVVLTVGQHLQCWPSFRPELGRSSPDSTTFCLGISCLVIFYIIEHFIGHI